MSLDACIISVYICHICFVQHGHEADGGCECAGLTMRGKHWLVFDKIDEAHHTRRVLSEQLNFPATMAFSSETVAVPSFSALSAALPENVKLVTLTNNYQSIHDGKWLLRLSHLYEAGEHSTLATPTSVNLTEVFANAGLTITAAEETTLTANQPLASFEARKHKWTTHTANDRVEEHMQQCKEKAFTERVAFSYPIVTIRPMEVRTFLATFH
jgi:alpha-mannosidase